MVQGHFFAKRDRNQAQGRMSVEFIAEQVGGRDDVKMLIRRRVRCMIEWNLRAEMETSQ
jgi:hypothetical protein